MKTFLLSLLIFTFLNCESHQQKSEKKRFNLYWSLLYMYFTTENHALLKYTPVLSSTSANWQYAFPSNSNRTSKKKIIFIHGWDFTEKSYDPPTTLDRKIFNIQLTWYKAIKFVNYNEASVSSNYDIYFFTYRTSDSISLNGKRLSETLKNNFSESDKVIIIAHSMGGLVTRYAVYDSTMTKDLIDYAITLGTPHYGSPFSSSAYQSNLVGLGSLIDFVTNTTGGKNLAHTNTDNTISISGAINTELDALNANTAKDLKFYPFSGHLNSGCGGASETALITGCNILLSGSPSFAANDGVVPLNSAQMSTKASANKNAAMIKLGFDHSMMSFRYNPDESIVRTFFDEVIAKSDGFAF